MRQGPRLDTHLNNGLKLHPGVQVALRFLQVPTEELSSLVEEELLSNPLLEVDEEATAGLSAPEPEPAEAEEDDRSWLRADDEPLVPRGQLELWRSEEEAPAVAYSLGAQLLAQIALRVVGLETRRTAEYLVGCLDGRGYLACSLEEASVQLGAAPAEVERGLDLLQSLEPAGVGARDLPECLVLQLRARGLAGSLAERIVIQQHEALLHGRFAEIARALHVGAAEVDRACAQIRRLSPCPGRLVDAGEVRYIYPDLMVDQVGSGYEVWVNDRQVPRLRLSGYCRKLLEGPSGTEGAGGVDGAAGPATEREQMRVDARTFVRERARSARWLIQALDRRRDTMLRVMRSIASEQREFLEHGIDHLKPMTLRSIAGQVGLHESTVARVTAGKYVQTPRGIYPLKFFFSSRVTSLEGEDLSARAVRERIRVLIQAEDHAHPWSDEAIARQLAKEGVSIARRTVAKYREQLKIERAQFRRSESKRSIPGSGRRRSRAA
ncbi:MAG: RNA polymerase factor sigma-54 [Candidatus Eisenbacteria bacterium]|nr:RNA polymerase factor sigma-54 [Candidatus Eisenbacteria bacterium]